MSQHFFYIFLNIMIEALPFIIFLIFFILSIFFICYSYKKNAELKKKIEAQYPGSTVLFTKYGVQIIPPPTNIGNLPSFYTYDQIKENMNSVPQQVQIPQSQYTIPVNTNQYPTIQNYQNYQNVNQNQNLLNDPNHNTYGYNQQYVYQPQQIPPIV